MTAKNSPSPESNGRPPTSDHAPKQKTQAERLEACEKAIAELNQGLAQASFLIAGFLENQAVSAAMPQFEQQLRQNFHQQFQQGGLAGLMQMAAAGSPPPPPPEQ